jgi:hypothetical protein
MQSCAFGNFQRPVPVFNSKISSLIYEAKAVIEQRLSALSYPVATKSGRSTSPYRHLLCCMPKEGMDLVTFDTSGLLVGKDRGAHNSDS